MSVDTPMTSYCLGDIANLSQGLAINVKTKHLLVKEGLPLLRITDLINSTYSQFINSDEVPLKCVVTEDEIIYTRTGQVGLVFRGVSGVVHNNCFKVIPNKDLVDPNYLYWFLSQSHIKEYANNIAAGSVQKDLNHSAFKSIQIDLPPLDIQRKIYPILDSLSHKIELNHQINQTLEAMAQAIFKSWFIDFEPVKAKIAAIEAGEDAEGVTRAAMSAISGKTNEELDQLQAEKPECYIQLKTTAELFPAAVQDSEFGEIPEGWKVKQLDHIANYQNGLALQKFRPENEDEYLPVLKIAQLNKGFADGDEKASINIKPEFIVENGDVIFSWSGSLMVDIWCGGKAALNQHLFKVTSDEYPKWFYYYWTKHHLKEFQRIAAAKAVTMGHIKREHLSAALCTTPSPQIFNNISKTIGDILGKAIEVRLENFTLKELRDTLLPKLLSGELSVDTSDLAEGN